LHFEFSNSLRKEGIDTILDQYEESPLEGWARWICLMIWVQWSSREMRYS